MSSTREKPSSSMSFGSLIWTVWFPLLSRTACSKASCSEQVGFVRSPKGSFVTLWWWLALCLLTGAPRLAWWLVFGRSSVVPAVFGGAGLQVPCSESLGPVCPTLEAFLSLLAAGSCIFPWFGGNDCYYFYLWLRSIRPNSCYGFGWLWLVFESSLCCHSGPGIRVLGSTYSFVFLFFFRFPLLLLVWWFAGLSWSGSAARTSGPLKNKIKQKWNNEFYKKSKIKKETKIKNKK